MSTLLIDKLEQFVVGNLYEAKQPVSMYFVESVVTPMSGGLFGGGLSRDEKKYITVNAKEPMVFLTADTVTENIEMYGSGIHDSGGVFDIEVKRMKFLHPQYGVLCCNHHSPTFFEVKT